MDSRHLLFLQLFLLGIVAALHMIGSQLYLYWMFWWYDMVVHFLASIWIALSATWIAAQFRAKRVALWVFVSVALVSLGWESFEYMIGAVDLADGDVFVTDTVLDLVVNMIGGLFGWYVGRGK